MWPLLFLCIGIVSATPSGQIANWCYCNPSGHVGLPYLSEVFYSSDPVRMNSRGGAANLVIRIDTNANDNLKIPSYKGITTFYTVTDISGWLLVRLQNLIRTHFGYPSGLEIDIVSLIEYPSNCTDLYGDEHSKNAYEPFIALRMAIGVGFLAHRPGWMGGIQNIIITMMYTAECNNANMGNTFWTTAQMQVANVDDPSIRRQTILGGSTTSILSRVGRTGLCDPDLDVAPRYTVASGPFELAFYYPADTTNNSLKPNLRSTMADMTDCDKNLTRIEGSTADKYLTNISWPVTNLTELGEMLDSLITSVNCYDMSILHMGTFHQNGYAIEDLVVLNVEFQCHPNANNNEMVAHNIKLFMFIYGDTASIYSNNTDDGILEEVEVLGFEDRNCSGHVYDQLCPAIPSMYHHYWRGTITRVTRFGVNHGTACAAPVQIACTSGIPNAPPDEPAITFVADVAKFHTASATMVSVSIVCIIAALAVHGRHPVSTVLSSGKISPPVTSYTPIPHRPVQPVKPVTPVKPIPQKHSIVTKPQPVHAVVTKPQPVHTVVTKPQPVYTVVTKPQPVHPKPTPSPAHISPAAAQHVPSIFSPTMTSVSQPLYRQPIRAKRPDPRRRRPAANNIELDQVQSAKHAWDGVTI
jgi:hypothetical protein